MSEGGTLPPVFAVVLAAGKGTRMKSNRAKVLHTLCGVPMVNYVTEALKPLSAERLLVAVGHQAELVEAVLPEAAQPARHWGRGARGPGGSRGRGGRRAPRGQRRRSAHLGADARGVGQEAPLGGGRGDRAGGGTRGSPRSGAGRRGGGRGEDRRGAGRDRGRAGDRAR